MMIEKQRNLKTIKKMNKGKNLEQLTSLCLKVLEDKLMRHDVENVYNIYLKHQPIKMGIQNGPNTMDHNLTTSFNYHPKLIW
jgi:hypothetical protein